MVHTRKDFIAGLGGLFAVASLPACGEDNPAMFPERGKSARLNLSYAHISAGATEPLLFIAGIILILLEIFLPTLGIVGTIRVYTLV